MNDAIALWEKAKELKIKVSLMNSQFFEKFQKKYPDAFKNLGSLTRAYNRNILNDEILKFVQDFFIERDKMLDEMNDARTKSEKLFEEIRNQDKRILLDPRKDGTPVGEDPKLKQCNIYPLRFRF